MKFPAKINKSEQFSANGWAEKHIENYMESQFNEQWTWPICDIHTESPSPSSYFLSHFPLWNYKIGSCNWWGTVVWIHFSKKAIYWHFSKQLQFVICNLQFAIRSVLISSSVATSAVVCKKVNSYKIGGRAEKWKKHLNHIFNTFTAQFMCKKCLKNRSRSPRAHIWIECKQFTGIRINRNELKSNLMNVCRIKTSTL